MLFGEEVDMKKRGIRVIVGLLLVFAMTAPTLANAAQGWDDGSGGSGGGSGGGCSGGVRWNPVTKVFTGC
jgi:hypothetical protein